MRFSHRFGFTPKKTKVQLKGIDNDLRNALWNVFHTFFIHRMIDLVPYAATDYYSFRVFSNTLWCDFYKQRIDSVPYHFEEVIKYIERVYFKSKWFEVYDFFEFLAYYLNEKNERGWLAEFRESCNNVLEKENSGYRLINTKISPITNSLEIKAIEESISRAQMYTPFKGANIHLLDALNKLSDKKKPDYRNSIKESISAVESVAKKITGKEKDSLSAALQRIKSKVKIHPSLERGFLQIYNYTSDGDGIRHSLMDEPNCDAEDAKFMLVSCSAFINYLIVKADKAGIQVT